jgi:Zn-finger nucleic acid-binding protein
VTCPTCQTELKMAERQGVEIDYCPQCRGVWLDRGELDKIIERQAALAVSPSRPVGERQYEPWTERRIRDRDDDDNYYGYRGNRGRGWLGDMFDFD